MPATETNQALASSDARRLRRRANQIQRAIAAVQLAVDGLSGTDRLIVLNDALTEALREERQHDRLASVA